MAPSFLLECHAIIAIPTHHLAIPSPAFLSTIPWIPRRFAFSHCARHMVRFFQPGPSIQSFTWWDVSGIACRELAGQDGDFGSAGSNATDV
jgi:hypothetical protein